MLKPVVGVWIVIAICFASGQLYAGSLEQELDYLFSEVEKSGCTFIRNGSEHDSADAADHLRLKSRRGKKYYDDIDQFIDRLATKSSWSGKAYSVQCPEQDEQSSAEWLHGIMENYPPASQQQNS